LPIFYRDGAFIQDKLLLNLTAADSQPTAQGYGSATYGTTGYGGSSGVTSLIHTIAQEKAKINEFSRIILRITASDQLPHTINFFSMITTDKQQNWRLNNLQQ